MLILNSTMILLLVTIAVANHIGKESYAILA